MIDVLLHLVLVTSEDLRTVPGTLPSGSSIILSAWRNGNLSQAGPASEPQELSCRPGVSRLSPNPSLRDRQLKIENLASLGRNRRSSQTPERERDDNAQRRLVRADDRRTAATSHETGLPPEKSRQLDCVLALLKNELALWRAFLGDEIDAILRDKD